jgi:hypothetical protein
MASLSGRGIRHGTAVRQRAGQLLDRVARHSVQQVREVSRRIDGVLLRRLREARKPRRGAGIIGTDDQSILAAYLNLAQRPFRGVVVDRKSPSVTYTSSAAHWLVE